MVTTDTGHRSRLQLSPLVTFSGQRIACSVHPQPPLGHSALIMNRVEPLDQSIGTNSTELPAFEDREDVDNDEGEMSPQDRDGHKSLEPSEMDVRQSTAEMRSEVTIRADDPLPSIQSHHSETRETVRDNLTDGTHERDGHTVIMPGDSHEDGQSQINGHAPVALLDNTSPVPDTVTDTG